MQEHVDSLTSDLEPKALLRAAVLIAASDDHDAHEALGQQLRSAAFLARLDTAEDYQRRPRRRLRVRRVLLELTRRSDDSLLGMLTSLTSDATFLASRARTSLLIEACAAIRGADGDMPAELIQFLGEHCQHNDGYSQVTARALVDNGSEAALTLFAAKLCDPSHVDGSKIGWMRNLMLEHRNELAALRMAHGVLREGLAEELRVAMVEVLFDHRPLEWYAPYRCGTPPDSLPAPDAEAELVAIGRYALDHVELSPRTRAVVRARVGKESQAPGA